MPALFFFKFFDIGNLTVESVAQCVKRFCADCLAFFDAVNCVCGKALLAKPSGICYNRTAIGFFGRLKILRNL